MVKGSIQAKGAQVVRLFCLAVIIVMVLSACAPTPLPQTPFPDYGFKPPAGDYPGPFFKLSQDYPTLRPELGKLPVLLNTDFTQDWRGYLMQARDYCFDGNIDADWRVENNKVRKWYHMPWQHYSALGREAIRGLTKEASLAKYQLSDTQDSSQAVAYALGIYNEFGGYAIGRVWKDHNHPDPTYTANEGFPVGTVVCKLLFVSMPPDAQSKVKWLVNPLTWEAYAYTPGSKSERSIQQVALIQLDVMVRDSRARFGWVFGTFQYNGALNKANRWDNLVPIGLQWGNDPDVVGNIPVPMPDEKGKFEPNPPFTTTPINTKLVQTYINPNTDELPPTHLGWGGRLAGPADNPGSSCFSCHMTASYPDQPISGLFAPVTSRPPTSNRQVWDTWWMQWFQNNPWPEQFRTEPPQARTAINSLDFSLQLSDGIKNFYLSKATPTPTP